MSVILLLLALGKCPSDVLNEHAVFELQNFVVAGGSPNGTIAVITLPLSFVRGSPGQSTTLTLDAQNSSPRPGTTITQWVWAIITLPERRAVTNATGRITQVRLRPGE